MVEGGEWGEATHKTQRKVDSKPGEQKMSYDKMEADNCKREKQTLQVYKPATIVLVC